MMISTLRGHLGSLGTLPRSTSTKFTHFEGIDMLGSKIGNIGTRLGAGFGVILAVLLCCNLLSWMALSSANRHLSEAQSALTGASALAEAQSKLWELRYGFPQFMVGDDAVRAKIMADESKLRAKLEENLAVYAALPKSSEEAAALSELRSVYGKYMDARPKWFELYGAGKLEDAKQWRAATTTPFGAGTVKGFASLIDAQKRAIHASEESAKTAAAKVRSWLVIATVSATLLVVLLAFFITRSIVRPVGALRASIEEAQRSNDLTLRAEVAGRDEVAQTAMAFNAMMETLQGTLKAVVGKARQVASSAGVVATASGQVSASSRAQSESAASTAAAVEQVTVTLAQVAESTREASGSSAQASTLSAEGEQSARNAAEQMSLTVDSVGESMRAIESLARRSAEISGIVKVISEIAAQTNLLALNAAIEAARAGEQGRGFAVVADEVRKLAERTGNSTSEISGMIAGIQGEIDQTVASLKENNERVLAGKSVAEQVAAILSRINEGANVTLNQIRGISAASSEQSNAYTDIARNIERIAQASEETNAAVAQTNEAALGLDQLASSLDTEISRFKV
jgi:methyl-accepting chemotaxis protein